MEKYAVLGMDVEDWFHLDYFNEDECDTSQSTMDGVEIYLNILKQYNIKATFFVVGSLVTKYKDTLEKIIQEGHEIALHSYAHKRPLTLSINDFIEDTRKGKSVIKEVLNIDVKGYRAPCFSLDRKRLDILKAEGLVYDASKIDFGSHNLYGDIDVTDFKEIQPNIYKNENFTEFETSTVKFLGKSFPISGGGYLRIFPWFLTKVLIKKYLKTKKNYFFYIHPFEFSKEYSILMPEKTDLKTRIRFNLGRKSVEKKMHYLIKILHKYDYNFVTFEQIKDSIK